MMNRLRIGRLVRAVLPALVCMAAAHAEWLEVTRDSHRVVYQDPAADRVDGSIVHTRELLDYLEPHPFFTLNIGSEIVLRQYDCARQLTHRTRVDMFETRMGTGKPFDWNEMTDAPWVAIAAQPGAAEALRAACARQPRPVQPPQS